MSSIDPSNQNIVKIIQEGILFLKENKKKVSLSVILFLFLGILFSKFVTPTYEVQAILTSNEEVSETQSFSVESFLSNDQDFKGLNRLFSTMTSQAAAEKMWEMGYHHDVFLSNYDPDSKAYFRESKLGDYIRSYVVGYEINEFLGPSDIKALVKSRLFLSKDETFKENYSLTIETSNPEVYIPFLTALIEISDSIVKEEKLSYAKDRIDFLKKELSKNKDRDVTKTLSDSMKTSYLNISLLSNDLPYTFRWVERPRSTIYPASPNLAFIYIFFMFLGFSTSSIYLYVRKIFV